MASEYKESRDILFSTGYVSGLLSKIDVPKFINSAFGVTFVPKQKNQIIDSGTFQGKILNQMEKNCLDTIKTSIIIGSFDAEKIINDRFANECTTFTNENIQSRSYINITGTKAVNIIAHVSKVTLNYKFYKKRNEYL
ncbi:MAG: hypothetical protein WC774_02900 [Candidatus Gracilibacteria bacterium]